MIKSSMAKVRHGEKGFSLIEMAIVLVIIGLIVTAITVGKNTMRSAELNRLYTGAVGPWVQAIYGYYAKTGTRLECAAAAACRTALAGAGLVVGDSGTVLAVGYTDSAGVAQTLTLSSVANDAALATVSNVTMTDSAGQEGIVAVQGYVNGSVTDSTLTFNLTQFSTGYQTNM